MRRVFKLQTHVSGYIWDSRDGSKTTSSTGSDPEQQIGAVTYIVFMEHAMLQILAN